MPGISSFLNHAALTNEQRILVPPTSHIEPPSDISPQAREIWSDVVAELGPTRILTTVDIPALVMLCEGLAEYRATQEVVKTAGRYYTITDAEGNEIVKRHPAVEDLDALDKRIRGWVQEFCMSPASRARATLSAPTDTNSRALDLSVLTPDEREAVRQMISSRQETRQ